MEVEAKHEVLFKSLTKFYEDDATFETFRAVLGGSTKMSLRVLDWLVTNYAKKRNIVYGIKDNDRDVAFNMFLEYKSQLKAYSKRYFDPFCRRGRVMHRGVETTCGQLNFFRWAIKYGVLDYALRHHDEIEQDMLSSIQHRYSVGTKKEDSKRKELSKAAIKSCTTTMVKVKVKFS